MKMKLESFWHDHWRGAIVALAILAVAVCTISLAIGFYSLSFSDVFTYVFSPITGNTDYAYLTPTVFHNIRLPRILSSMMIGAALSVSGCAYQGMFRNPLVSPDVLGVSSAAGAGAATAITLGWSSLGVQAAAFVSGTVMVFLAVAIARRSHHNQTLALVLTGIMIGSLCNAVTTWLKYIADPNESLAEITFWLMGSLIKVDMYAVKLAIWPMLIGFILIWLMRYRLNILVLDDEEAISMGVNIRRDRTLVIIAATLLSAAAVCLGGLIGWVGLMIPHICRAIVGADYRKLIPVSALLGGIFLVLVDDLARSMMIMEIPIGILTSLVGAPFFIMLILKKRKI